MLTKAEEGQAAAVSPLNVAPRRTLKSAVPSAEGASPPGLTFIYALSTEAHQHSFNIRSTSTADSDYRSL